MIASTSLAAFSTGAAGAVPGSRAGGAGAAPAAAVSQAGRGLPVTRAPNVPAGGAAPGAAPGSTPGAGTSDRSLRRGSRLDILA